MKKTKQPKSEKFMETCLQVLALQFPDVKIKYGYNSTLTNLHVVDLISENDLNSDKVLMKACDAITIAFKARLFDREEIMFTTAGDDTYKTFKVDHPMLTWNMEMSEEDRLHNEMYKPYLPDAQASKEQAA